jgi:hypothetical protein
MLATFTFKDSADGNEIGVIDSALYDYTLWENNKQNDTENIDEYKETVTEDSESFDLTDFSDFEVINTEFYSIKIPITWSGKYRYEQSDNLDLEGAYTLRVYMKCNGNEGGLLFSILMYDVNDHNLQVEIEDYGYDIGRIKTDSGNVYELVWEYSGDRDCSDEEANQYFAMQEMVEPIIDTILLNGSQWIGTETETTSNVNTDDVPFIGWTSYALGQEFNSYCRSNSLDVMEFSRDTIHSYFQMQNDDDVTYYSVRNSWSDVDRYFGVRDGIIVSDTMVTSRMQNNFFTDIFTNDVFYDVNPKRVNWGDGRKFLIWGISNGYLVIECQDPYQGARSKEYYLVSWYSFISEADMNEWMEYSAVPDGF